MNMNMNIRTTDGYNPYQVDCPGHPGPGQTRHGQGQEEAHQGARHRAHCQPLSNCFGVPPTEAGNELI